MGNKKSDYNVRREVTGTRQPGAVQPDEPQSRVLQATPAQDMGEGDAHQMPIANVPDVPYVDMGPVAEFDRMYRRLHPIRFSVARRLARMDREQQRAREIEAIRDLTRNRRNVFEQLGFPHFDERFVERNLQRQRDEDPLNQFNRRIRRRFEEAMAQEADVLTQQIKRLRIADPQEVDILSQPPPTGVPIRYPVTARQNLVLPHAEEVD